MSPLLIHGEIDLYASPRTNVMSFIRLCSQQETPNLKMVLPKRRPFLMERNSRTAYQQLTKKIIQIINQHEISKQTKCYDSIIIGRFTEIVNRLLIHEQVSFFIQIFNKHIRHHMLPTRRPRLIDLELESFPNSQTYFLLFL